MNAPLYDITLWPHRSLPASARRRLLGVIGLWFLVVMLMVAYAPGYESNAPVAAALWIGFFAFTTLFGLWLAFYLNNSAARIWQRVRLFPHKLVVESGDERKGRVTRWEALPYAARVELKGAPIPDLALRAGKSAVSLGGFLSAEERIELALELERALADCIAGRG